MIMLPNVRVLLPMQVDMILEMEKNESFQDLYEETQGWLRNYSFQIE